MSIDFDEWLIAHDGSAYSSLHIASDDAHEDFVSWFRSNGGYLHKHVELTSNPSEGNYLGVKEGYDLLPGSTVVSCPHDLTLSWPAVRKYHFPNVHSNLLPHVATRLYLMKQYLLKSQSPWWPYIRSLPQPDDSDAFRTPMYYNQEDLVWIQGTNLEHARNVRQDAWHKEYSDAFHRIFGDRSKDEESEFWTWWVTFGVPDPVVVLIYISRELYLWACTVISSRSYPGPAVFNKDEHSFPTHDSQDGRSPVLIPGLDVLNHSPSSRVAWLWDASICTIQNDEMILGGSQILNNYGPKSNAERKTWMIGMVALK